MTVAPALACSTTGGGGGRNTDVLPVVATGTGMTPAAARDDAFRQAIEEVVGTYIFSEMSLEEDHLNESIFDFSAGVIEDYQELYLKQDERGVWSSKVLAEVNTEPITSKLFGEVRITEGEFDGASAVKTALARKSSRDKFVRSGKAALTEVMASFPEDYIYFEQSGDMLIKDVGDSTTAQIDLRYDLCCDHERLVGGFFPAIKGLLGDLAEEQPWIDLRWKREDYSGGKRGSRLAFVDYEARWQWSSLTDRVSDAGLKQNVVLLFDIESVTKLFVYEEFYLSTKAYLIDSSIGTILSELWIPNRSIGARLTALGEDGEALFVSEVPIVGEDSRAIESEYLFITPLEDVGTLISPFPASGERSDSGNFYPDHYPQVTFSLKVPYSVLEKVVGFRVDVWQD